MKPRIPRKTKRGFACMDVEKRRAIARKGGAAVSQDRDYMGMIGTRGGTTTQRLYKMVRRSLKKGTVK